MKKIPELILLIVIFVSVSISSIFLADINSSLPILVRYFFYCFIHLSLTYILSHFLSKEVFRSFSYSILTVLTILSCIVFDYKPLFLFVLVPVLTYTLSAFIFRMIKFESINKNTETEKYVESRFTKYGKVVSDGIILLKMVVSYLLILPIVSFFETVDKNLFTNQFNLSSIIALTVIVVGIILFIVSNIMDFKRKDKWNIGLYKRARYPEILGEVLIHFGIYLFLISLNSKMWVLFLSPLVFLLFNLFIIIPINEGINKDKDGYLDYKNKTNLFNIFKLK